MRRRPDDPDGVTVPYDFSGRREGRVLVVDNDADVRAVIEEYLASGGFDVTAASTGAEGLRLLRADSSIALVLLDLRMPDMDGWRFRQIQMADARLTSIPTVILTGTALPDIVDAELQAAEYLLKPVGREHLLSVARNYCIPNARG